jgi:micrococcal nuclease
VVDCYNPGVARRANNVRHGRRHRWDSLFFRFVAVVILCAAGRDIAAQVPAATTPATQGVNAWATGGVSGTAAPGGGPHPYWQAPALPSAVIQGGAIPAGWTPQAVPYQGIGPDGRPVTMYYSPTYVFTYQIGPPVIAAAAAPVPNTSQVNRRQAMPMGAQPASMQGWNYQTQGAPAATYTLPPATVARYQPVPYQYPPGSKALTGTPIVPPQGTLPATSFASAPPTYQPQPSATALAPPPASWGPGQQAAPPPSQWAASTEAPPPGLVPQAASASAPQDPAGQAFAAAAPPMVAGSAAAIAAATQPSAPVASPAAAPASSFPTPISPSSTPAQPVSVSPLQSSANRAVGPHLWRVVGVHDGDTVTCLDESNQQQKVRLAEIDAPEIGQDYGKVSREVLAEMVFGKTVEVTEDGKDRYGRWIGHLSSNGVDVNRQMIATGNAWHYEDYSRDTSLAALQSQAQSQRLGLWAQPSPVAPWDYRKSGQQ